MIGGVDDDCGSGNAREQDRFLPIANIGRIMKKALPSNAKIAKDAKETVQECVSEFISFITSEASDKCQREKRKTINGDDLLWAIQTLGFEDYVEPLKLYLHRFREAEAKQAGEPPPPPYMSMVQRGNNVPSHPVGMQGQGHAQVAQVKYEPTQVTQGGEGYQGGMSMPMGMPLPYPHSGFANMIPPGILANMPPPGMMPANLAYQPPSGGQ